MADDGPSLEEWLAELKRRKVFRVAAAYAAVGFVLVQATAYLFEALLFPEWAHRLFVVFVILGFPVALVLAWAFELTPAGIRPSRQLAGEDAEAPGRFGWARGLAVAAVVTVVAGGVAAGGWAAWEAWLSPEPTPSAAGVEDGGERGGLPSTRIAVLYFDDHSRGQELEHVAAGFTESLIHELNRAEGLDVISRNGVKPFRDPQIPLDSIARVLGAGSLVEGSVEREGDELLVTVQLVDGATASHLMSERLRGHVDAPLQLRNQLVERVADLLRRRLGREVRLQEARAETESSRAWELYHLAGDVQADALSFRQEGDREAARRLFLEADSILARAEELDPDWRWPTIRRGAIAQSVARLGGPAVSGADPTWLERGIAHADRVLSEDPDDAAALELRGELRYFLARTRGGSEAEATLRAAEEDLRRAVAEDPERAAAWSRLAYLLWNEARFAEARSAVRRSREADPFLMEETDYLYLTASLALDLEEFERADRLLREALEEHPDEPAFLFKRLQYLASTGRSAADVAAAWDVLGRFESITRTGPWAPGRALVAAVAARAGMGDSARAVLERAGASSEPRPDAAANAAYAYLQLGDEGRALDHLARFLEANPAQRDYVAREWWWRPLRDHPRWRRLVADSAARPPEAGAANGPEE